MYLAPALGEINRDVAEVGFGAATGRMVQGNEGLTLLAATGLQVAADLVITARVAILIAEAAEQLTGGVPLLARGVVIGGEQGVGDHVKGTKDRGGPGLRQSVRLGLRVLQGFADGISSDAELLGDLTNAEAVAMSPPEGREVVHRAHPSSLRPAGLR
jgi:hypothetical protein